MFDTMKIAKVVRQARIDQNMTQMNLADAVGVSYQAVSNWERGNSMPDISKLEQLCGVLHISVNQLLGMEEAFEEEPVLNVQEMTVAELKEAAPALLPTEVKARVKEEKKKRNLDLDSLVAVAPFLDEDTLGELLEDAELDDVEDLVSLAPFLHTDTLDKLLERCDSDDLEDLAGLAPFLSKEGLERHVERILADNPDSVEDMSAIAPFLPRGSLARIMKKLL